VAVTFAWLSPWQSALALSVGLLVLIFTSGLTLLEAAVILANFAVVAALLMPSVSGHGDRDRRRRSAPSAAAPAPNVVTPVPVTNDQR